MTLKKIHSDPITNSNYVLLLMAVALAFLVGGWFLVGYQLRPVAQALTQVVVTVPDTSTSKARREKRMEKTTWAKRLGSEGTALYIECRLDSLCNKGLRAKLFPTAGVAVMFTGLLFIGLAVLTNSLLRRKRDQLDDAKWLAMDPDKHPEVTRFMDGDRDAQGNITDPVIVQLGYVIEQLPMPNSAAPERPIRYKYVGLKKIGLTTKMLQEHVLVYGPTGTGKTSRVLLHFLLAFARRGDAVVVPDFKYPEINESFMQAIALFRRMGNPTYPVLPYALGGYHIPIFDYIQTHQMGRDLAAILVPEPEYRDSDAAFYKQTQQIILGTVLKVVAASPTPNFSEVIRICQMPQQRFESWLGSTGDSGATAQLERFMVQKNDWNGFITGILNALEAFDDDRVSRTFTSVEGRNFDVERFVLEGGLLYFGVNTDKMRSPRGEVITRVFDNWLTNQIVRLRTERHRTGPQRSVRLMYDEAPSIGRLRAVLKSVSTLRSMDVCFIFGIQNEDQMRLVYGDDVWGAITQLLGTQIILPTGFKDDAAITLSRYLGEREIRLKTQTHSAGQGGVITAATNARKGHSYVTQKRALATPTEISEWPYFLGILRTKGTLPPALLALVPMHDPRPVYYGLDGRQFTLNNQDVYDEWTDIMEDLPIDERTEEITGYIEEHLAPEDRHGQLNTTLKDVFNEWVRFAILDGTAFRRSNKQGSTQLYEFRYETLHPSLRGEGAMRAVRAFIMSGWIDPGQSIVDSPEEWEWVKLTKDGLDELGKYALQELANIRYSSAYIQERKRLEEAAPELGARYEEAREVLPYEAAHNATIAMLRSQDGLLSQALIEQAAALVMNRFQVVQAGPPKLVAIPLSLPFERIVPKVLAEVQGRVQETEVSWDERLAADRPAPVSSAVAPAEDSPRPPASPVIPATTPQVADATPPVSEEPASTQPAGTAVSGGLTGSQGEAGTPDLSPDDDDEDEGLTPPPAPRMSPSAPSSAPAASQTPPTRLAGWGNLKPGGARKAVPVDPETEQVPAQPAPASGESRLPSTQASEDDAGFDTPPPQRGRVEVELDFFEE